MHCAKRNRPSLKYTASICIHIRISSPLLEVIIQVKPFTWANVNIYGNSARRRKTLILSQEQTLYVMNVGKSAVSNDLPRQVQAWPENCLHFVPQENANTLKPRSRKLFFRRYTWDTKSISMKIWNASWWTASEFYYCNLAYIWFAAPPECLLPILPTLYLFQESHSKRTTTPVCTDC